MTHEPHLPSKVALITEAPVDHSHGTGSLLLRLIEGAPFAASCVHLGAAAPMPPIPSFPITGKKTLAGLWRSLRRRIPVVSHVGGNKPGAYMRNWVYSPGIDARRQLREADHILAVVYSAEGLRFVHDCLATLPYPKPTALWFMDLLIGVGEVGDSRRTLSLLDHGRIWAFNSRIKAALEELFPQRRHRIEQRMFLGVPIPEQPKRVHRAFAADMRCVMIGNLWDTSVLPVLEEIWKRACNVLGVDLPLHWHAPPEAFARLAQGGMSLRGGISYKGYAQNLEALLTTADVAIMAFSVGASSASLFSRYSFPSRVADYAAHGLPVFSLCGHDTPLAEYLKESEAGIYETGESVETAVSTLVQFLRAQQLRQHCSVKARSYALAHFDINQQKHLFASELRSSMILNPIH